VKTPWLGRFPGFLVTSAVLIGVAVLAFGFVVGRFFERQQLAHEEEHTTKVVQTQARQHLVPDDFALLPPGRGHPVFAVFLRELPDVVRIKVYDRSGQVVWSDEPRLIGLAFPDNPYLARALRGEVATVMQIPRGPEHVYEQAILHVAETYVPVTLPGRPELLGARVGDRRPDHRPAGGPHHRGEQVRPGHGCPDHPSRPGRGRDLEARGCRRSSSSLMTSG
jgi:hypothetical protein